MKNFEHFIRFQLPAVAWAILIFVLSSIPGAKLPAFSREINDKLIHTSIYFVFGLLLYRALQPRNDPRRLHWGRLLISVGLVVIYGLSDEFHQRFVPGRTEDILDATADSIGGVLAAVVVFVAAWWQRIRHNSGG